MLLRGVRQKLVRPDHYMLMRIPEKFWDVTLASVEQDDFRELLKTYIKGLDANIENGDGLLLWGNNGVGKTGGAAIIAKEVRRRACPVLFITAKELREASLSHERFNEDYTVVQRALNVDFLVLDELGHEGSTGSDHSERLMESLFRVRSAHKRPTLVTTNLKPYARTKADETPTMPDLYPKTMMEVFRETMHPYHVQGRNRRDPEALKKRLGV